MVCRGLGYLLDFRTMKALPSLIRFATVLIVACSYQVPLRAQWQKFPTPGIPRMKDGNVDFSAPPPKDAAGNPDLSGMWMKQPSP